MTDQHHTNEWLETPKQLAKRVGISERQIRHLVQTGRLDHVMIGCRVHIPNGAFKRFLESRTVRSCPDETTRPKIAVA
jgi:excisionase family DNA binding protein